MLLSVHDVSNNISDLSLCQHSSAILPHSVAVCGQCGYVLHASHVAWSLCLCVENTGNIYSFIHQNTLAENIDINNNKQNKDRNILITHNHITTRISIQTARLAFGGTGLCS